MNFKKNRRFTTIRDAWQFWTLCVFLVIVFLIGGSGRADITSLVILRPLAIIICGVALLSLRWEQVRQHSFLFAMTLAVFLLVGVQLIPLPPSLWHQLPGREIVIEIDRTVGLKDVWRPISLVPGETWNALYSLFVPLAVLLLIVQCNREQKFQLLPFVIGIGLFSGLWGILQIIGDPKGPAYLYRITNQGAAVGLFANRNHQAVFLATLFPMLAVYASSGIKTESQLKFRTGVGLAGGAILIPLLLVTGSRAGFIVGILSLLSLIFIWRKPKIDMPRKRKIRKINWQYPVIGLIVFCLIALTIIMSRAQSLQRLSMPDQAEDLRFSTWGLIAEKAWAYFPIGTGLGSFAEIYKIFEPTDLLSPSYFNHAHNDWLELYLTGGLPVLILLLIAAFAFVRMTAISFRSKITSSRQIAFGRLGGIMITLFALASVADYPLRVPSLACIFIIALIWLSEVSGNTLKNAGS